jgi:hypothetical protein
VSNLRSHADQIAPNESQTKVDATPRADEERRAMLLAHAAFERKRLWRGMSGDPAGPVWPHLRDGRSRLWLDPGTTISLCAIQ